MSSNRLVVAVIGAGCIAAAGVGGYIAARQTTTPAPVAAAARQAAPAATRDRPVQETEGVVGDTKPVQPQTESITPEPPAKAAEAPKRAESASRPVPRAPKTMQAHQATPVPALDHTWPTSASPAQSQQTAPPAAPGTVTPADGSALPPPPQEPPRAPEPPEKTFQELVVSADSVIGLQTENAISSERARVEDRVEARVTRDVRVGGQVAIPAGSRALGSVTLVERGGKFKERARLGIRFHTIVLADGTRLPISSDTLYREGEAPGNDASKKIGGGAVGGAILGAILGGAKGAAIGAATGGAAGAGVAAAGDRSQATLPAGSPVTVRLLSPVTVTVEK